MYAPVWVLFKKVPQELWSIQGFSTIASAVGFPVHSEFSDIKPYSNGIIKLRVVVELEKKRPTVARITDKLGNSVLISVEFLKMPPKCVVCGEFGHLRMRCPGPAIPPATVFSPLAPPEESRPPLAGNGLAPLAGSGVVLEDGSGLAPLVGSTVAPLYPLSESPSIIPHQDPVAVSSSSTPGELSRSVNLASLTPDPPAKENNDVSSSNDWTEVAYRSKLPPKSSTSGCGSLKAPNPIPLSSDDFAAEEEIIQKAQSILRSRLTAMESKPPEGLPSGSKKHQRRKLRQKIYLMTSSSSGDLESEVPDSESALPPASVGQAPQCSVQSGEA